MNAHSVAESHVVVFLVQSDLIKVVRPCWINKLEPFNGLWRLFGNEKPRGEYDAIVIAHNEKPRSVLSIPVSSILYKSWKGLYG
jgi:hypothetical protein